MTKKDNIQAMQENKKELTKKQREPRTSFVMYTQYREQFEALDDERAGKLIKAILCYAETGEAVVEDPVVSIVLMFFRQQMDIDRKRYEDACEKRREAARKAGKASAEKRSKDRAAKEVLDEMEKAVPWKEQRATDCNTGQRFQHDNENVNDNVNYNVNINDNVNANENENENGNENGNENDLVLKNKNCCSYGRSTTGAREEQQQELIAYGADQIPTTRAELAQMEQLARDLFDTYMHQKPTKHDYERVFLLSYRICYTADDQSYAAYSEDKAQVLRHVFQTAADQGRLTWRYMDGIYDNYEQYGVKTLEDAIQYEKSWNRGEIV